MKKGEARLPLFFCINGRAAYNNFQFRNAQSLLSIHSTVRPNILLASEDVTARFPNC